MISTKGNVAAKIYLLVGFFGSGKTTFIRKLLNNQKNQKYAIIQNEFAQGQMGIQQPLIMDQSGTPFSSFLQLPNGCICCSAKNDLVAAVEYILENTAVRNVVVETNGLADPAQSIKQFWFDEEMNIKAELHSVIAVVSARKWEDIYLNPIFEKQIVYANKALVTFMDTSPALKYEEICLNIREMNCQCHIARSDQVDISTFLSGESLFDKSMLQKLQLNSSHNHHHKIKPIFIQGKCLLKSKTDIEQRVGSLLWQSGLKILRIKGVICLDQSPLVFELQGVQDLFEVKQTKSSINIYGGQSKILVVGQDLQKNLIATVLNTQCQDM